MSANNISLKSSAKLVWLKRAVALSVLFGFAWLVLTAITTDVTDEELNPTVVKAPELIKQRPETPGGMKIDHQDKQLFDLLESETSVDEVNAAVIENAKKAEEQNKALAAQAIEKKALEAAQKQQEEAEKAKAAAQQAAKKAEEVKVVAVKKVEAKVEAKPVVKAVAPVAVKPAATVAKQEVKTAAVQKGWAVQLGSFRKDADADRAIGVYNKKVGNILTGLTPYVKKVDLGSKGTVYRVYFTGLKDAEHAKQICSQLKAQKQACLRAKI